MNKQVDFYKTLQVHHDAGQDIIDAAYRCLSKIYHPDVNKSPMAGERMKDINVAYGVIGDTKRRKEYHVEWMRQNAVKPMTSSILNREKQDNTPDPVKEAKKEEEAAARVLDEFFCETVNERWENAYQKLTKIDSENIPPEDFLEWKRTVSQIYKLGNYKITYFRRYTNCDYAGVIYPTIFQFTVGLTEMQVSTKQISEENTQKYVAFDGDSWRVCLGYTDLKPTIIKFKYLAQVLPKLDKDAVFMKSITKIDLLTGLYSLTGFVEQAEREVLRSQRYGNPLSLAVVTIKPVLDTEEILLDEKLQDACISYVAEILCANIRKTDLIGRCNSSSFSLLFTETKQEDAEMALEKLLQLCEEEDYFNYEIYSACVPVYKGSIENVIFSALENTIIRRKDTKDSWNDMERLQTKLGKYKLSDILGFNKKGKNHF